MDILKYNEFDARGLSEKVDRAVDCLKAGNFRAADVKKLAETRYYRSKLNDADRLLFTFADWNGRKYILLLEVILNHEYAKSRFLNGAAISEDKMEPLAGPESIPATQVSKLRFVNEKTGHFHLLDKIISFDEIQNRIFHMRPPVILIGSAGSGKTVLTLEKMKQLSGDVLYITLSPFLAENARNLYYSNGYENDKAEVSFLSFREFIESIKVPEGSEISFRRFEGWFARHRNTFKVREAHKLYEEIHGVLTGSTIDSSHLDRAGYLSLGVRQSIFLGEERAEVYDIFSRYLEFLEKEKLYNPNMVAFDYLPLCKPSYDFVVADEVQDLTSIQLCAILKTLRSPESFILCGDANQIVHPNFFSWSRVKTFFYEERIGGKTEIIRILNTNYRNSRQVTDIANQLLLVKNARFGSIDRESNYLVKSVSEHDGAVDLLRDDEKVKREINSRTQRSTKTAIMVLRPEDKADARRWFNSPLVFSIQEAKGLEYENVVLLNFVSGNAREFNEIIEGVAKEDLAADLKYSRARDKGDKSLDAYKFYINALYVALTRAVVNLYIVEKQPSHGLYSLVGLAVRESELKVKAQESSVDDWKEEARRLELQGKTEQAEEIRRVILAQKEVPWKVITPANLEELKKEALDPANYNRQAKLLLFEYALMYQIPYLFGRLVGLKFNTAADPDPQMPSVHHKYYSDYREKQTQELTRKVNSYGVDFRNPLNQTPLMIAAKLGMDQLVNWLTQNGGNRSLLDNWGRNPLQIALREAYNSKGFAAEHIGKVYSQLAPSAIRVKINDRVVKIDNHKMEFFLLNSMLAVLQDILRTKVEESIAAFETADFIYALEHFPDYVIPEYRKRRRYITSVLAVNEIGRADPRNKALFVRIRQGFYILNPFLELEVSDKWLNVYDMIGLSELEKEDDSPNLKRFIRLLKRIRKEMVGYSATGNGAGGGETGGAGQDEDEDDPF